MSDGVKKTVFQISCGCSSEFRRTINLLIVFGNFVYRYRRDRDVNEIMSGYGWAGKILIYAHSDCKRTILSKIGDEVDVSKFNLVNVTVDEFFEKGYHKY